MPEEVKRITKEKSIDVYTMRELCELLDMERQTVMKHIKENGLVASKIGNKYYFTREHIIEWLENNKV